MDSGPTEDTTGGGGSHVEQARHSAFDRIPDGIARFANESRSLPVWPAETTVADDLTRAVPGRISRPEASTESVDSGGDRIQGSPENQRNPEGSARGRSLTVVWNRVPGGLSRDRAGRNRHPRGPASRQSSWRSSFESPKLRRRTSGSEDQLLEQAMPVRPPRLCEPPNRAAPRASYGGLPTNRMVEGAQPASVRTRLALDRVALRRVFRPGREPWCGPYTSLRRGRYGQTPLLKKPGFFSNSRRSDLLAGQGNDRKSSGDYPTARGRP